jgi:hypothetical protein
MDLHPTAYESYEGFLKAAIKAFWDDDRTERADSLALLLASREAWEAAVDRASAAATTKNLLTGAAGAAAVTVLLRTVLGGPIGVLLTGASLASMVGLYAKHSDHISARTKQYRRMVTSYRGDFEQIREDYLADKLRRDQRDLMVEGLFARFLGGLSEPLDTVVDPPGPRDTTDVS